MAPTPTRGLRTGAYDVDVASPDDELFGGGTSIDIVAGERTVADSIRLRAPAPPPSGTTITNVGVADNGVPSVLYTAPLSLRVSGCPGIANPTYSVYLANGEVVRDRLPLVESPSGVYAAQVAPLYPNTGDALIRTTVPATCAGTPVAFNIYIDPSGVVTDSYGVPIAGATVTLLRSETADGEFASVPDGSDIMSVVEPGQPLDHRLHRLLPVGRGERLVQGPHNSLRMHR